MSKYLCTLFAVAVLLCGPALSATATPTSFDYGLYISQPEPTANHILLAQAKHYPPIDHKSQAPPIRHESLAPKVDHDALAPKVDHDAQRGTFQPGAPALPGTSSLPATDSGPVTAPLAQGPTSTNILGSLSEIDKEKILQSLVRLATGDKLGAYQDFREAAQNVPANEFIYLGGAAGLGIGASGAKGSLDLVSSGIKLQRGFNDDITIEFSYGIGPTLGLDLQADVSLGYEYTRTRSLTLSGDGQTITFRSDLSHNIAGGASLMGGAGVKGGGGSTLTWAVRSDGYEIKMPTEQFMQLSQEERYSLLPVPTAPPPESMMARVWQTLTRAVPGSTLVGGAMQEYRDAHTHMAIIKNNPDIEWNYYAGESSVSLTGGGQVEAGGYYVAGGKIIFQGGLETELYRRQKSLLIHGLEGAWMKAEVLHRQDETMFNFTIVYAPRAGTGLTGGTT